VIVLGVTLSSVKLLEVYAEMAKICVFIILAAILISQGKQLSLRVNPLSWVWRTT
jgi:hypothetical protein